VSAESLVFFFLAAFAVTTAILMIVQRNPLMSAIFLISNFFSLAALYLLLRAQLLAVLQIIVYTGAIMVLVIFVIMLLNLGHEDRLRERYDLTLAVAVVLVGGLAAELIYIFTFSSDAPARLAVGTGAESLGTVEGIGSALFGRFLLPFEVTSILLLVAIIGAVVLARKKQ
jgi:NADH-quinone oxidoreductase subunit J